MTVDSQRAIGELYRVFSKYPPNFNMEANPLYAESKVKEWNRQITAKPFKEMDGDELSFFVSKVGYTRGR